VCGANFTPRRRGGQAPKFCSRQRAHGRRRRQREAIANGRAGAEVPQSPFPDPGVSEAEAVLEAIAERIAIEVEAAPPRCPFCLDRLNGGPGVP
jgi:hypothetical protein